MSFTISYTGDYLNEGGELAYPDLQLALYNSEPNIQVDFFRDQGPQPGDKEYWDRLYSMAIEPRHVARANGIVIFRPWVRRSAFANGAENLVVIGRAGAGYDKIDLEACTQNDVVVFNAPDTLMHSTASSAFLFILALGKRLQDQQRLVTSGRWDLQPQTIGDDLPDKTLGIIGLGETGRELARLMRPWQMNIIAYSPRASSEAADELGVKLVPSLDQLLSQSDFVSLHNRLEDKNRGMMGEGQFRLMKNSAYFINVARGELVKQKALIRALKERWIAGAGLDVFEHEPLSRDDELLTLDNVLLTPHWLPATKRAARLTMSLIARGMIDVANGRVPKTVINQAVLNRDGFCAKLARYRNREDSR